MFFSSVYTFYATIIYIFKLIFGRLLIAAFVVSVFIPILSVLRKKLSPELRSWLWIISFICLLLPFERASLFLFAKFQPAVYEFSKISMPMLYAILPFRDMNLFISHFGPALYAAGFVFFVLCFAIEQRKTYCMIQNKTLSCCASYFHQFRSRIYMPQNFQTAYTEEEQAILLSHEKQHIAQYDPILYYLLAILQSMFWFCPAVHRGVRLFKQDRELLCDERVMKCYSARDYGLLLLKAAQMQKGDIGSPAVGIVPKGGMISERISMCITPVRKHTKAMFAGIALAAFFLALSVPGFFPIMKTIADTPFADTYSKSMDVFVIQADTSAGARDDSRLQGESLKPFLHIQEDGINFDRQTMYDHAVSIGLSPEDTIGVKYLKSFRPAWTSYFVTIQKARFTVADMQTHSFVPFETSSLINRFFEFLYRSL